MSFHVALLLGGGEVGVLLVMTAVVFMEEHEDDKSEGDMDDCSVRYLLTASLILVNSSATPDERARSAR